MCEPISATTMAYIAIGTSVAAGAVSAYGQYQQGKTQAEVARNNAQIAEYQAQDAKRRGDVQAQEIRRRASLLAGTQRATMAARGLDLSSGTPADILAQTDFFSQIDQNTARDNAAKEAWAKRAQKGSFLGEASAASAAGNMGAFSTLLGTAGSVSSKWYSFGGTGGGMGQGPGLEGRPNRAGA